MGTFASPLDALLFDISSPFSVNYSFLLHFSDIIVGWDQQLNKVSLFSWSWLQGYASLLEIKAMLDLFKILYFALLF